MTTLMWDETGKRFYETGVDRGVLYQVDNAGEYVDGVAWNGLTAVTASPTGAEATPVYADNMKYLNLLSAEEFGGTIEALTYPLEFEQNDGSASPTPGVSIGQQKRKAFGFSWRSKLGNDLQGADYGYKIHLVYGCLAAPSEKPYTTVNDSPEPMTLSWELTTTPVAVGLVGGEFYNPTSKITIDSTEVDPAKLAILEQQLYGTPTTEASMPLPADVIAMMSGVLTTVTPTAPTYNNTTDEVTIPAIAGVEYRIAGEVVTGNVVITQDVLVTAHPLTGYRFPPVVQDEWFIDFV